MTFPSSEGITTMKTAALPPRALGRRALLAALPAFALPGHVSAQGTWPNRPIRLIIPFAPGGSTDALARMLNEHLQPRFGQPIIIENRPGAGATLGTGMAAEAPADGYTMLLTVVSAFAVGATLYQGRINWDPLRSFAHVAMIQRGYYALMANNRADFSNPGELATAARRSPGLAYATSGVGSMPHLFMLRYAQAANIELTHIPYRGGGQAVTDTMAGVVPVTLDGIASSVGFIRNGQIKGIGLTGPERAADFPQMHTFVEHGFRDLVAEGWAGIAVPAATPLPIQQRIAAIFQEVQQLPAVLERYKGWSVDPGNRFMADMEAFVRSEVETWRPLVIASGATPT
jgi:tripartite-type tricarboxylate transporter receptor subunit TctC